MLRALQVLVGTYDADVVLHEVVQLVLVVGDDHVLVRIGHLAGVLAWQVDRYVHGVELGDDVGTG